MKRLFLLRLLGSTWALLGAQTRFSAASPTRMHAASVQTPGDVRGQTPGDVRGQMSGDVRGVTVCTGKICQCHDPNGADELLAALRSRSLNIPIAEDVCMGHCTSPPAATIDFADGSCQLVAGLDETLCAMGLAPPPPRKTASDAVPAVIEVGDACADRMRASALENPTRPGWLVLGEYLGNKVRESLS